MNWHGYFVLERLNIGAGNWASLKAMFDDMGTHDSVFPCYNTHLRTRLDGDAVLYESLFDTEEVSIAAFKQLLADVFGVPIEDIHDTKSSASYAGGETTIWRFWYPDTAAGHDRFLTERFGNGGSAWGESGDECRGYLALHNSEWETVE